ncbi:hypothetical protein [uncultured Nostoc sp.]|uniref:hypothetical protein n=1 Tax=uncultured Nostoc sp. TaxID=340711 RepID=UPI0035CB59B2
MSYDIRAIKHNTRNLKEPEGKSPFIIDISEKSQNYIVINLYRAVLKNLLIWVSDEATLAVDNQTEAAIWRSLEQITVDRTTIAFAHLQTHDSELCSVVISVARNRKKPWLLY